MKCLNCLKSENEIMLMKLPVETTYEDVILVIMGNVIDDEYMCLSCIGYQFDESFARKRKE